MILRILIFTITLSFLYTPVVAQKDGKKTGKIAYKYKMQEARHQFLSGENTRSVLNTYRDLLKEYTNDAMLNYRIGECHLKMKNYSSAVEYFQNARRMDEEVDKEINLKLGEAYHHNNQLDKSLKAYKAYSKKASKKNRKYYAISERIANVDYAKKMLKTPVKVKVENLGKKINSKGGDYAPSVSADGKTMVFTSRRSDTKGGRVDRAGDFKYYEDIYIAHWDTANSGWEKAESIKGKLNTDGHDASLSISPDGKNIFIYRNNGRTIIGDIFVSKLRSSGSWGNPKSIGKTINTSYFESSASLSADGNKLYFVSEKEGKKKGAQGGGDIYVVEKVTKSTWGEPKNLGSVINTPGDEISVFIHPDGKTLFFSSDGHLSIGGLDIYMSKMQADGTWSKPENLGYPINTVQDDLHFVLSTDGETAYYSAIKEEGYGERDIYKIYMDKYPVLSEGVAVNLSILRGNVLSGKDKVSAQIEFKDTTANVVAKTTCDDEGNFFITLAGGNVYTMTVTAEGFKPFTKDINLALGNAGKTYIRKEDISLEKMVGVE